MLLEQFDCHLGIFAFERVISHRVQMSEQVIDVFQHASFRVRHSLLNSQPFKGSFPLLKGRMSCPHSPPMISPISKYWSPLTLQTPSRTLRPPARLENACYAVTLDQLRFRSSLWIEKAFPSSSQPPQFHSAP